MTDDTSYSMCGIPDETVQLNLYDDQAEKWTNHALECYAQNHNKDVQKIEEYFPDTEKKESWIIDQCHLGMTRLKLNMLYNSDSLSHKDQACHPRGVGGSGFVHVVKNPKFPEHEFFRAGRVFRARIRHGNACFEDDAMLDGRVACIKFADDNVGGPLDLILSTGRSSLFYNCSSYENLRSAFDGGCDGMKKWCQSSPMKYFSLVDYVRRGCTSYYDQTYYGHFVYNFTGKSGEKSLAKLRMMPADGALQSGLVSKEDQQSVWETNRQIDGDLRTNYLRLEYVSRLKINPLQYRLQIQLYKPGTEPDVHLYNPCLEWNQAACPWLDLAIVTIPFELPPELVILTEFDLWNHPTAFSLREGKSVYDVCSAADVARNLFGKLKKSGDLGPEENPATEVEQMEAERKTKYLISVETGDTKHAGTDANIFITITGTKGRTIAMELDNMFHDDFEAGQVDMFEVDGKPVGKILTLQMDLKPGLLHNEWYLDCVTVTDVTTQQTVRCPCYRWLTPKEPTIVLRRGEALLPQSENLVYSYLQRKYEIEEMRQRYQWEKVLGLPGRISASCVKDVPREARFNNEKLHDLSRKYWKVLANTGVSNIRTLFTCWDALHDYSTLITGVIKNRQTVKSVAASWQDDAEFGRQFLNGPHPVKIQKLCQIPINLMITAKELEQFLDEGTTLQDEIKNGRVYHLSYPEIRALKDELIQAEKELTLPAPMCILYVDKNKNLKPIAIQLSPVPHHTTSVWTPADDPWQWTYAKMWIKLIDAHVHHMCSRHLQCHLVLEAISVATMRNLPLMHPLYKLLVPHIRFTVAVNVNTRFSSLDAESIFEKYLSGGVHHEAFARVAYRQFKMSDINVIQNLKKRDVADDKLLPNYYYRDDAVQLWRVIKKFVRTTLMLHYRCDSDVQSDEEVQMWVNDLHLNGLPQWDGDEDHEVPSSFSTVEELIEFITCIIFNASCQHAALTSGVMDYYAFCPNYPTKLLASAPNIKETITEKDIVQVLPNKRQTAQIVAACYTLAKRSQEELFLGEYPDEHFCNDEMLATIDAFQIELKQISDSIKDRNESLEWPYTYLLPQRIPNSVAI